MENELSFSFDDEIVIKFCYDLENKKIEVYYDGYYDLKQDSKYIKTPCCFIIEKWEEAKSQILDDKRKYDLNSHIGIFKIILSMEFENSELILYVANLNGLAPKLIFTKPCFRLV